MRSDRVTEGHILGENRLLWNMLRIPFALTYNAASEGEMRDTSWWSGGLAIGLAWIGKWLFVVMAVSGTGVLWDLNERPETIVPAL